MSNADQTNAQSNLAAPRAKADDGVIAGLITTHQTAHPDDKDPEQNKHVQHIVDAVRGQGYSASMARVARLMRAAPNGQAPAQPAPTAARAAPAVKKAAAKTTAKKTAPAKKAAPERKTAAAKKAAA
jgi:hypothetical protein